MSNYFKKPFLVACKEGDLSLVKLIVGSSANVILLLEGLLETITHRQLCCYDYLFSLLAKHEWTKLCLACITKDVNYCKEHLPKCNSTQMYEVWYAAFLGKCDEILNYLTSFENMENEAIQFGLNVAGEFGNKRIINLLYKRLNNSHNLFRVFINACNGGNLDIVQYVFQLDNTFQPSTGLQAAAEKGHVHIVDYLLTTFDDYHWLEELSEAYYLAMQNKHYDLGKYLLENSSQGAIIRFEEVLCEDSLELLRIGCEHEHVKRCGKPFIMHKEITNHYVTDLLQCFVTLSVVKYVITPYIDYVQKVSDVL